MTNQAVPILLPEILYNKLKIRAHTNAQSVDDFVIQTLTLALPPTAESDLPIAMQSELTAMEQLSDDALWAVARSVASDDTIAVYDMLLERQHVAALTPEGQHWLERLRNDADSLMLRKAHAYALLKARGYALPSLNELHAQAS